MLIPSPFTPERKAVLDALGNTLRTKNDADALTHVGQLTMLRRMFGAPVRGENYLKADIVMGRVGPEQSAPRREFE